MAVAFFGESVVSRASCGRGGFGEERLRVKWRYYANNALMRLSAESEPEINSLILTLGLQANHATLVLAEPSHAATSRITCS